MEVFASEPYESSEFEIKNSWFSIELRHLVLVTITTQLLPLLSIVTISYNMLVSRCTTCISMNGVHPWRYPLPNHMNRVNSKLKSIGPA